MRNWLLTWLLVIPAAVVGCDTPSITVDLKGQPNIPAQPAPPRFQLVMHPEFPGRFTYLLDTQTGAIWTPKEITYLEGKPTMWVQEKFKEPLAPSSAEYPMSDKIIDILYPQTTKEEEKK